MKLDRRLIAAGLLAVASRALAADTPPTVDYLALASEGSHSIKEFSFVSGEALPELRINFATWGVPIFGKDGSVTNAVLLCHGTTNTWQTFARPDLAIKLFGTGKPLDISRYFVVASDAIGAGKSSKPSDGLRMKFPKYRVDDVVKAQYLLLTEKLKVKKLRAVLGISYGGRQTWQWAVQYPEFMHAAIPVVSSPFPNAGRRGMQDFLGVEPIISDPAWRSGEYTEQPYSFRLAWMMYRTGLDGAGHLWEAAPTREQSFAYLPELAKKATQGLDANDWIYQMRVNDGFDAFSQLSRVKARILMINVAGDELVPLDLRHAEKTLEKLGARAEYLLVKEADAFGHFAASQTVDIWAPKLGEFLNKIESEAK